MELDDLKAPWEAMDRRLQAMESLLSSLAEAKRADRLARSRSKLRLVRAVLSFELAFGVLVALPVGSYLVDHLATVRFALPAAILHLMAIALIGTATWQLVRLAAVDFAGPVVETQRRLAEIRLVRARTHRWSLFAAPLLWAVFVVVVPHGLGGNDVYRDPGLPWVVGNFAVGVVALAVAGWLVRRYPDAAFLRRLGQNWTGRRLAKVADLLDEVESFERER